MERFLSCIDRVSLHNEVEDKLYWEESKEGFFLVKSMYAGLRLSDMKSFLGLWSGNFWKAVWGKIFTCDQLQHRVFLRLIDATFVVNARKVRIIYSFIVARQKLSFGANLCWILF